MSVSESCPPSAHRLRFYECASCRIAGRGIDSTILAARARGASLWGWLGGLLFLVQADGVLGLVQQALFAVLILRRRVPAMSVVTMPSAHVVARYQRRWTSLLLVHIALSPSSGVVVLVACSDLLDAGRRLGDHFLRRHSDLVCMRDVAGAAATRRVVWFLGHTWGAFSDNVAVDVDVSVRANVAGAWGLSGCAWDGTLKRKELTTAACGVDWSRHTVQWING